MTRPDDERDETTKGRRADDGGPGDERPDGGRVPPPEPEEAPELLGERSDYPIPHGGTD
jgi:hypothetical protein